jgi:uncharacterized protein (TIGR00661 family)
MRILYGVVGEGMGHATRSRVVIEHLLARGHEVEVVVSGRAHDVLAAVLPAKVRRIHGFGITYADNAVQKRRTLLDNARALVARGGLPRNVQAWFELVGEFDPELVISDFESWSWLFAVNHRLPLISIDNIQILHRCDHRAGDGAALLRGHEGAFQLAKAIVKAKVPGARHYFITTFFYPPVRKRRTTLVPPILRPEVLAAKARVERGDHVVVYQTGEHHGALVEAMRARPDVEFLVYGLRRDLRADAVEGNVVYRPFAQQGFIDDLAGARAVVAGGGFSLMGECVFLGKPLLAVPLAGQFEQTLNALWLERLGYGLHREEADAAGLDALLERELELAGALAGHQQDGNRELFAALDAELATIAVGRGRRYVSESPDVGDGDGEDDDAPFDLGPA